MALLKRVLPSVLAFVVGMAVLGMGLTPYSWLDDVANYFIDLAVIVAAFALFLGLLNILRTHARRIGQRQAGRGYSLVLLLAMLLVLVVGLPPGTSQPSGPSQSFVQWIFESIQLPIQASLSALLVFFILAAAYRVLLVRSLESTVLLVVALLVLVGQVTAGLVPVLPELKDWILDVPVLAGVRGFLLGVALGALLSGLRLLLGFERPYSD